MHLDICASFNNDIIISLKVNMILMKSPIYFLSMHVL